MPIDAIINALYAISGVPAQPSLPTIMAMSVPSKAAERLVLGLETSCDETAAGLVVRSADGKGRILANVVRSQLDLHRVYGGVVPELAARAHLELLDAAVRQAFHETSLTIESIDAVAATAGPGLIGGLLVGLVTGKAIAAARGLPLLAINHLEAHALTPGLTHGLRPPYLLLLASGGHTQTLAVSAVGKYARLGTTLDDALGEAFDKTAKILGLGYPGGPEVERRALTGDPRRFALPRPMLGRREANFSFAGLKTAVRHAASGLDLTSRQNVDDLCASFQQAVVESVLDRLKVAMALYESQLDHNVRRCLVVAGGVAANARLREAVQEMAEDEGYQLVVPPGPLCTDNGVMIAWAGAEHLALGSAGESNASARARWPLDELSQPLLGGGRLGPKA